MWRPHIWPSPPVSSFLPICGCSHALTGQLVDPHSFPVVSEDRVPLVHNRISLPSSLLCSSYFLLLARHLFSPSFPTAMAIRSSKLAKFRHEFTPRCFSGVAVQLLQNPPKSSTLRKPWDCLVRGCSVPWFYAIISADSQRQRPLRGLHG